MHSSNILILILLCKMLPVSGSCPKCPPDRSLGGCKCACNKDQYLRKKPTGVYKCEVCTEPCSAAKHLVQVRACGNSTNRVCHCAKGYYCDEPQNYSCLLACKPCKPGTFSSETSLEKHCKPYTDCEGQGVATKGTATQDQVCVTPTTRRPSSPDTFHTPELRIQHSSSITKVEASHTAPDSATSVVPESTVSPSSITDHSSSTGNDLPDVPPASLTTHLVLPVSSAITNTLTTNRRRATHALTSRDLTTGDRSSDSPASQKDQQLEGSSSHLWLTVLFLVVSILMGCFLWFKGKALKKQLKWTRGVPFGKYQMTKKEARGCKICAPPLQQQQLHEGQPCLERLIPVGTESGAQSREDGPAAQTHPGQANTQHVTMDGSGRGESVSNTVGSIFIYSPGMVVLGSNASERREEMRQEVMEPHLSSTPQQESRSTASSCLPDSVGLSTQEEDEEKELSYPIPASGK